MTCSAPYDGRKLSSADMAADCLHTNVPSQDKRSNALWWCPADNYADGAVNPDGIYQRSYCWTRSGASAKSGNTYIPPGMAYLGDGVTVMCWSPKVKDIPAPSRTLCLVEIRYIFGRLGSYWGWSIDRPGARGGQHTGGWRTPDRSSGGSGAWIANSSLHPGNGKWNYLYCDGHAETKHPKTRSARIPSDSA